MDDVKAATELAGNAGMAGWYSIERWWEFLKAATAVRQAIEASPAGTVEVPPMSLEVRVEVWLMLHPAPKAITAAPQRLALLAVVPLPPLADPRIVEGRVVK
jgi:hypothetical protein